MRIRTKPGRSTPNGFVVQYSDDSVCWGHLASWSGVHGKTRESLRRAMKTLRAWPKSKRGWTEPLMKDPDIHGCWT